MLKNLEESSPGYNEVEEISSGSQDPVWAVVHVMMIVEVYKDILPAS